MAADSKFVTAPSTPEAASPTAPEAANSLEIVVEQRLREHDGGHGAESGSMTIFRVPAHVRDASKELYEPRLVSVGPYYRGRPALRAMEQHKLRYLHELLTQHRKQPSPAACVRAIRAVEQRARRCYSERTDISAAGNGGPDDGFCEMLLLDGCFILQFFIKWHNKEDDELCDVGWGLPLLHSDLLLLENQIPFFVLEALFGVVAGPEADASHLRSLILPHLRLFSRDLSGAETARATGAAGEIRHLLHLLYEAIVPPAEETASVAANESSPPRPVPPMGVRVKKAVSDRFAFVMRGMRWVSLSCSTAAAWFSKCAAARVRRRAEAAPAPEPETTTARMVVPSVTQLRKAGVRFEAKSPAAARHVLNVTFDAAAGVVRMPRLVVDHASRPLLANLVAFEQTLTVAGAGVKRLVSSYAALVSSLVRTGEDVEHLQGRGAVDNLLGTDAGAAAEFFQKLGDCAGLDYGGGENVFGDMFGDLNRYYRSSWRRHKAELVRDYCRSPWAALALVVAGCAFCFALFKFSTTIYGLAHPYCHC